MDDNNKSDLLRHLDTALDALLAARGCLGPLPQEPPDEALEEALRADRTYQQTHAQFANALAGLIDILGPGPARDQALRMEETVHSLVYQGAAVGWRLGLLGSRRGGQR